MIEIRVPQPAAAAAAIGRATFTRGERSITVDGFEDGSGLLVFRFMPDQLGTWSYHITINGTVLGADAGSFECTTPGPDNHGPVVTANSWEFRYADGTPYRPVGTTCYVWTHQDQDLCEQTLRSLAESPFNKIRMCVFPKNYSHNKSEPRRFPFPRAGDSFDLDRFDPDYFDDLERQILRLQRLGIECDLILFHPYDKGRWGFDRMPAEADHRYVRHVVARLAAFRNVWWSMANEYDFMTEKTTSDWDALFDTLATCDPYGRLASIHNGTRMYDHDSLKLYDHHRPEISHVSLQHWDLHLTPAWLKSWTKPVSVDECGYEGNLHQRWGNLTAEEVSDRTWTGTLLGGHVGHGETFYDDDDDVLWWSHGGKLHGQSPARIQFLHNLLDQLPAQARPLPAYYDAPTYGVEGEDFVQYYGTHRPARRTINLPADAQFEVDIIDTWNMTTETHPHLVSGETTIGLPATTHMAIRVRKTR